MRKIFAAFIMATILPMTYASPAEAAHVKASLHGGVCTVKGNTVFTIKVHNTTERDRFINWSLSLTSEGARGGYFIVDNKDGFQVRILDGESARLGVWTRTNQKTQILDVELKALKCFD